MSDTDLELLARYTRQRSSRRNPMEADAEDAFAEIVRRHLGLVHSAALRQVRSPQLAEEVAQATFINLARHAHRLAPDTILAAWLYQVARRGRGTGRAGRLLKAIIDGTSSVLSFC